MSSNRRTFLKQASAALTGALAAGDSRTGRDSPDAPRARDLPALDPAALRAVAEAALPESLGAAELERAVSAFERWLADFEPNAELVHPYGGWVIPYGPADPEPRWAAQLGELARAAEESFGEPLERLAPDDRRTLLAAAIEDEGPGLPDPGRADHIAVALMAHWFRSPEAVNRCYGARIDRLMCRTTATAGEPPEPLP